MNNFICETKFPKLFNHHSIFPLAVHRKKAPLYNGDDDDERKVSEWKISKRVIFRYLIWIPKLQLAEYFTTPSHVVKLLLNCLVCVCMVCMCDENEDDCWSAIVKLAVRNYTSLSAHLVSIFFSFLLSFWVFHPIQWSEYKFSFGSELHHIRAVSVSMQNNKKYSFNRIERGRKHDDKNERIHTQNERNFIWYVIKVINKSRHWNDIKWKLILN